MSCATTVSLNFASSYFNVNKFSISAFFAHRLLNSTNIGLATLEAEATGVSEVVEIFLRPNLKILLISLPANPTSRADTHCSQKRLSSLLLTSAVLATLSVIGVDRGCVA